MRPQAAKQTVKDTVPSSRCLLCADSGFSTSMLVGRAICKLYSSAAGNSIFAVFVCFPSFRLGRSLFHRTHLEFEMYLRINESNRKQNSECHSVLHLRPARLVEPQKGYLPPMAAAAATGGAVPKDGTIMMPTGHVSVEQLTAVLSTLPLDLTFVDAEDRVAFFTEGPDRIFARSKAIIGRKVQHCHPPRSVETVDQILTDFRSGRQSVAEFWINFHEKFVHVRYFAVRNSDGNYLGTVELTQDLTPLRALQGERRLLEYDSPGVAS